MLTSPWALLALVSVPIVLGIYFFRTRSRRREVSSLFLWVDRSQAKQGGRRIQRLQLPLLILLELLVLALLALAAARPMIRMESLGRPTAVILDASYSMTAGTENDTSKARAMDDLEKMLASRIGSQQIGFPAQFIVAGSKPQLLPGRAKNAAEARDILQNWDCSAPLADIDAAISLASNISTPGTKILVVTDQAPKSEIAEGKVLWKAFGRPLDNLAVIHASRVYVDERDRLLLEIGNLSAGPQSLRMTIVDPLRQRIIFSDQRSLEAGETHLIRTGIPDGIEAIEVRLADDLLPIDNRLTILPPSRRPVRVQLGTLPGDLAPKIRKAVEVSGIGVLVRERPELVFGSLSSSSETGASIPWTVAIQTPENSDSVKSFIGPFVIDHSSPLTTGLSLEGVVWSADESLRMDGSPAISAGDVPLVTEMRRRNGSRVLNLQLNDRLSTLTSGPNWPILIWNILKYRAGQTVGMTTNNLKLGAEAEFVAAEDDKTLEIQPPIGEAFRVAISGGSTRVAAEQVGVYQVKAPSGTYSFAVGTLSPEESNLQPCETSIYGNWFDEETLRTDFQSIAWAFLLGTLLLMTLHHWFISANKSEFQTESPY